MPRRKLIQLRRGTAAEWATANPVLAEGEPAVELDTGVLKVGDGVNNYGDLPTSGGASLIERAGVDATTRALRSIVLSVQRPGAVALDGPTVVATIHADHRPTTDVAAPCAWRLGAAAGLGVADVAAATGAVTVADATGTLLSTDAVLLDLSSLTWTVATP